MTIRRDCEELIRLGKIVRTIAGIQQAHAPAYLYENSVRARVATNRTAKGAIAAKTLELIPNQQKVLDISQIQRVVTEERTQKSDLAALRRSGVKVDIAGLAPLEHPQHAAYPN